MQQLILKSATVSTPRSATGDVPRYETANRPLQVNERGGTSFSPGSNDLYLVFSEVPTV
jgi:hypothetical protein